MLAQAGVPVSQLGRHDFLNSYSDVALAVLGGYFDAGALKDDIFAEMKNGDFGFSPLAKPCPAPLPGTSHSAGPTGRASARPPLRGEQLSRQAEDPCRHQKNSHRLCARCPTRVRQPGRTHEVYGQ